MISGLILVLLCALIWVLASLAGLGGARFDRLSAIIGVLASGVGLIGCAISLAWGQDPPLGAAWGHFSALFVLDRLSSIFLLPTLVVGALVQVYQTGYLVARQHARAAKTSRFFFGLLMAGIVLVFISRSGFVFLAAWELMAVSAFFLIAIDDHEPAVCRAAWIYLVATHIGTAFLLAMVALLAARCGGFEWTAIAGASAGVDWIIALLALAGFGIKAGLLPFHVWLPGAHAGAPSHVSAILSGVMLNTGIYGIVRITSLLPPLPVPFAISVMLLGALTMVYGIANALSQKDFKALLAYSSIENMGVITLGVGMGIFGRATDEPVWVVLGLGGAFMHVWNHSFFKSLLFTIAGAILHATGTRQIDRLGGLARRMPRTVILLAIAVLAASGLPPLNGFVGEWLLYRGLMGWGLAAHPVVSVVALFALVLTGAVAAAAFSKFFGIIALGEPRSAYDAHDPKPSMMAPMIALAAACVALTVFMPLVWPIFRSAVVQVGGIEAARLPEVAGDLWMMAGAASAVWLLALPLALLAYRAWSRRGADGVTWDCGYAAASPRIQYTGASFVDFLSRQLRPTTPSIHRSGPMGTGMVAGEVKVQVSGSDQVGEYLVEPATRKLLARIESWRWLQRGQLQAYLLYILMAVVVALSWAVVRSWIR
jgi:hydrogenase-4 component B